MGTDYTDFEADFFKARINTAFLKKRRGLSCNAKSRVLIILSRVIRAYKNISVLIRVIRAFKNISVLIRVIRAFKKSYPCSLGLPLGSSKNPCLK
ncbi:hypothetical protein SAMN05216354_1221 [Xylanibacter ruminicola]|uniref:Uncharacterized protein n=1 Tax=Xylanibacter ruminicola TaxID=839 RepID=A0A1H5U5P5_XYLRU|nr:hypothetical protein SAMN05216354_1221 [Xylanibacter ruminicola]